LPGSPRVGCTVVLLMGFGMPS